MTAISPTALEEAAKAAFEAEWERPWETVASYERDHFHGVATAAITAYLAQREKEGFVEVPVEPTVTMRKAAVEADDERTGNETCAHIYRAMLTAASQEQNDA
ncbi:hypothetical protein [Afipia carboxidovorans]|uniref:hypothetical protein n=1 Tax=Afipia carboxidovorans TaxID=40137 RepID=UPI003086FEF0|nr:hypothetical protein CRBSH125_10010 [Afipia carboxidovorans]